MSENREDLQIQNSLRFRISGITEGMITLRPAEVLDPILTGALVEHQGKLEPQSPCLLQVGTNGDLTTIRCRVLHSRTTSSRPGGGLLYQTTVEFLELTPAAKYLLKTLIQSRGRNRGLQRSRPATPATEMGSFLPLAALPI